MPATMEVRENGHALHFMFTAPLTAQELLDAMAKDQQYRDSVPYKVHTLIYAPINELPQSIFRARSSPSLVHPNRGYCAIVGPAKFVKTIAETIFKVARNNEFRFFETEDQAWEFLREKIASEGKLQS